MQAKAVSAVPSPLLCGMCLPPIASIFERQRPRGHSLFDSSLSCVLFHAVFLLDSCHRWSTCVCMQKLRGRTDLNGAQFLQTKAS